MYIKFATVDWVRSLGLLCFLLIEQDDAVVRQQCPAESTRLPMPGDGFWIKLLLRTQQRPHSSEWMSQGTSMGIMGGWQNDGARPILLQWHPEAVGRSPSCWHVCMYWRMSPPVAPRVLGTKHLLCWVGWWSSRYLRGFEPATEECGTALCKAAADGGQFRMSRRASRTLAK